jgi:hypothetical protein
MLTKVVVLLLVPAAAEAELPEVFRAAAAEDTAVRVLTVLVGVGLMPKARLLSQEM